MRRFRYKAKMMDGKTVSGIVEAVDERQAVALLRDRGLIVVSIYAADSLGVESVWKGIVNRVGLSELANFTRQLSTMISAGLNLVEALSILETQSEGYLSKVVSEVRRGVESGQSLAASMEAQGGVFNRVYVSLITAGEHAGVLDKVLIRLAETLEKQREFRMKVRGALLYPAIILFGMIGVMGIMVLFVIPRLASLYEEFETDLPWMTTFLINISNFATTYWWLWGSVLVGGIVTFRMMMANPIWRKKIEQVYFSLPVFGHLYEEILLTEMTRMLSLLSGAGVPIVEALGLVATSTGNQSYQDGITEASRLVEKGFSLSQAFGKQEVFPLILPQMLAVGEQTGQVDEIMMRISSYFESESEQKVKNLTTAIEPIILILLAIGVGFLVFAIVIPIYNLTNAL